VSFSVFFVCICVGLLSYCPRVVTKLQLDISYHIYHIVYHISYHTSYLIISYIISYRIISFLSVIVFGLENLKIGDHLEELGIDGSMMFNILLKEHERMAWL
jgi:hypothetical protein